jgi:mRNA interferase RelE/StbE
VVIHTLKAPTTVRSLIRKMHPQLKRKVRAALADILDKPECGKPLEGELKGLWSLRVGRHRIIYRPDEAGAEVVAIGPRAAIYEDTARYTLRDRRKSG